MFTPIDIQNHSLKTAVRGYSKKETDDFLEEILKSYEELYKENRDLKDKVNSLSDGIKYYKDMESTLQKALVLAEKTSAETQEAAKNKAEAIIGDAKSQAAMMKKEAETTLSEANTQAAALKKEAAAEVEVLKKETQAYSEVTKAKAKQELEETRTHVRKLIQSYENYRLQFKKLAESQIEMLSSEHYQIFAPELSEMFHDPSAVNHKQEPQASNMQTAVPVEESEAKEAEEVESATDVTTASSVKTETVSVSAQTEIETEEHKVEEHPEEVADEEAIREKAAAEEEARTEAAAMELLAKIRESIDAEKIEIEKTQPIDTAEVIKAEKAAAEDTAVKTEASTDAQRISAETQEKPSAPIPQQTQPEVTPETREAASDASKTISADDMPPIFIPKSIANQPEESVYLADSSEKKSKSKKASGALTADDMPPVFKTAEPKQESTAGESPFTFIDL